MLALKPPRVVPGPGLLPLALLAVASGAGCGYSLSYTVDEGKLRDMSRQGQLWVYDAENEVVVALDRLDEAKDERADIKQRTKDAQAAVESAEKSNRRAAVEVAEAWLVHLEALDDWADDNIKLQTFGLLVARATVELAKAQVIQREDLLGGKDFNVKDFEEQYQQLRRIFEQRQKRVQRARRSARKKEERWWSIRRRYIAQTGDHDTGLWVD